MPGQVQPMLADDLFELIEGHCAEGIAGTLVPTYEQARELQKSPAWTFFDDDLNPLACGGFIPVWDRRWVAWLYVAGAVPEAYRRNLIRCTRGRISKISGRIEAEVRADFAQGQRLLRTLGFRIENPPGVLHKYGPDGSDFIGYVRFND